MTSKSRAMRGNKRAAKPAWTQRVTISMRVAPETRDMLKFYGLTSGLGLGVLMDRIASGQLSLPQGSTRKGDDQHPARG